MSRVASVTAGAATGERAAAPVGLGSKVASGRAVVAALLGVVVAIAVLAAALLPTTGRPHAAARGAMSGSSSTDAVPMPAGLRAAVSASIGRIDRRFWPVADGGSLQTRGGSIHGSFTAAGARLSTARGALGLTLAVVGRGPGVGRGQQGAALAAATPTASANQVLYRHGSVREYYRSGPYGLEQGFSVAQRPPGSGELTVIMRTSGSLTARIAGSRVLFDTPRGVPALSYGQLSAFDANGRHLPAAIRLHRGGLQLQVDDAHARYPLRIDPFIQQGPKLVGGTEQKEEAAQFGTSVALSADGNTALVGAPDFDGTKEPPNTHHNVGLAWIFTRSGSTWTQHTPALVGAEMKPGYTAEFGASVALSANGYTALVGAPSRVDSGGLIGAAWVFTRSGSTWTQQGKALTGTEMVGRSLLGASVSLSEDGNTALIGGDGDDNHAGAAWVFARSGSTWSQDGAKLTGGGESGEGRFGRAVVLSQSASTALIGGPEDDSDAGAVWTFGRSGSTWTQEGEKLTGGAPTTFEDDTKFGASVALSAEATTALVGSRLIHSASPNEYAIAAASAFARTGTGWTQQGPRLRPVDQNNENTDSARVALSADGGTALLGNPERGGRAWVFTRSGTIWTQQGDEFGATEAIAPAGFGSAVALSAWGTALVGGNADNSARGAAWAYERVQPGCTDSWTNTSGGDWFTGGNWSLGTPPGSEDEACITAPGTYTVTMDQTEATGTVSVRSLTTGASSGTQTLIVAGSCSQNAVLSSALGIANGWNGALQLTNGDGCASDVTLDGPLANQGALATEAPHGGTRAIEGNLANNGAVSLGAGTQLQVTGGYQQTPLGRLKTSIAGPSSYGSMSVGAGIVLAGGSTAQQVSPFKAAPGENFEVIESPEPRHKGWQIGRFTSVSGLQLSYFPAVYLRPVYTSSKAEPREVGLTLKATEVHVTLAPKSGTPGTSVTITGGNKKGGQEFVPGDTITPTFTDHEGVVTTYPGVTVPESGKFTTSIAIPSGAALGEGTVSLTSSETGLRVNRSFAVT